MMEHIERTIEEAKEICRKLGTENFDECIKILEEKNKKIGEMKDETISK